jgi:hypothetical protein
LTIHNSQVHGISLDAHQWMSKENVAYIPNRILITHKEGNYVICRKMNETKDRHLSEIAKLR